MVSTANYRSAAEALGNSSAQSAAAPGVLEGLDRAVDLAAMVPELPAGLSSWIVGQLAPIEKALDLLTGDAGAVAQWADGCQRVADGLTSHADSMEAAGNGAQWDGKAGDGFPCPCGSRESRCHCRCGSVALTGGNRPELRGCCGRDSSAGGDGGNLAGFQSRCQCPERGPTRHGPNTLGTDEHTVPCLRGTRGAGGGDRGSGTGAGGRGSRGSSDAGVPSGCEQLQQGCCTSGWEPRRDDFGWEQGPHDTPRWS